jgi:hypothetical protein
MVDVVQASGRHMQLGHQEPQAVRLAAAVSTPSQGLI